MAVIEKPVPPPIDIPIEGSRWLLIITSTPLSEEEQARIQKLVETEVEQAMEQVINIVMPSTNHDDYIEAWRQKTTLFEELFELSEKYPPNTGYCVIENRVLVENLIRDLFHFLREHFITWWVLYLDELLVLSRIVLLEEGRAFFDFAP